MSLRYYDRQGRPLEDGSDWARLVEHDRTVAKETTADTFVSTVYLGLDHRFDEGPPLIFETMTFRTNSVGEVVDQSALDCWRYSTEDEAKAGHEAVVRWLKGEGEKP